MDSDIITVRPEEVDGDEFLDESSHADSGTMEDSPSSDRELEHETHDHSRKVVHENSGFIALDTVSYHQIPGHLQSYSSPNSIRDHHSNAVASEGKIVKRGRGRPRKDGTECKQRLDKEWGIDETKLLIQLWRDRDVLYNQKNKDYYDKEERQKALTSIKIALDEKNVNVTEQQILEKLVSLRSYYGSQLSKIEAAKAGGDNMYESSWKYFHDLSFLNESVIPRKAEFQYRNSPTSHDSYSSYSMGRPLAMRVEAPARSVSIPNPPPSYVSAPPSFASMLSNVAIAPARNFPVAPPPHPVVPKARLPVPDLDSRHEALQLRKGMEPHGLGLKRKAVGSPDDVFGQLITSMMGQLEEGEHKDLLKIEIQQMILKAKYTLKVDKEFRYNGHSSTADRARRTPITKNEPDDDMDYNHVGRHTCYQRPASPCSEKDYRTEHSVLDDEFITTVVPLPE